MSRRHKNQDLVAYYKDKFPSSVWFRWVSAGCSPLSVSKRELSFTLEGDVYIRYLSVKNLNDFKNLLDRKCPIKIDIGAVYDVEPSIVNKGAIIVSRELVFDIDLTDYDEIRNCCSGADICDKCWKFMVVAARILNKALEEDFGFTNILWVYSGRRGIHCWVSCTEAKSLSSMARSAVAGFLAVVNGGDTQSKKVYLTTEYMHSSIKRALTIIDELFLEIVTDQGFFSSPEGLNGLLKMIPDANLASSVKDKLEELPRDSVVRWKSFLQIYESYHKEHSTDRRLSHLIEEIKLQYCYPRLDINVTKGMNHLLKSPYSVHPKTDKVCVVFSVDKVASFRPDSAPSMSDLLYDQSPKHAAAITVMQESVSIFQQHVFNLEKEESRRKRKMAMDTLDF